MEPETAKVETAQEMEVRVRTEVKKEFEDLFQVWQAKDLAALAERQQADIKQEVGKLVKEYQEKQKPLTAEDIQKMLDQEYAEVTVPLMVNAENQDMPQKRTFVIRELPQAVEKQFYRQFVKTVKEKSSTFAALAQRNMDQPFETALVDFMESFEGAFDLMSEAVAIILNPFGKDSEITPVWVSKNIASNRQYSIIMAQTEVNKLRDFFSRVFQNGQQMVTSLTHRKSP